MTQWTRRIEFVSLSMTTWIVPLTFIIFGFLLIFYVIPTSNPVLSYSLTFLTFILGISWNTRFGVGGRLFMTSFLNYLKNKETEDDKKIARSTYLAIFLWPLLILILIAIFIRLFYS